MLPDPREPKRYYERIKMLPVPARTASGRRIFDAADLRILAFIRRARELKFPLDAIRAMLLVGAPENASCGDIQKIAARHLDDIHSTMAELATLECLLAQAITRCLGDANCPVLKLLDDEVVGKRWPSKL